MLKLENDAFRQIGRQMVDPVTTRRGDLYTVLAAGAHRIILRNFRAGGNPPWIRSKAAAAEGRPTLIERGNLFRSITRRGTASAAIVETTDYRAAIHHFGGRIYPKKAKMLTIPIAPEARGKRAGDFPQDETFILRGEDGKPPILMWGNKAIFVLVPFVDMVSRPFLDVPKSDSGELLETARDFVVGEMKLRQT